VGSCAPRTKQIGNQSLSQQTNILIPGQSCEYGVVETVRYRGNDLVGLRLIAAARLWCCASACPSPTVELTGPG